MKSKYTAVFFDWGGVMCDDPGGAFFDKILQDLGATEVQIKDIYKTCMKELLRGQITENEYWQCLHDKYGLSIDNSVRASFKKWDGFVANSGMLDLVKDLKSNGFKVGVLSNAIEPTYEMIDEAGYYGLFDAAVVSCRVGYAKPDEEIYRIALDRLDVSAEESIFVDDKQRCLDPAEKLGFETVLAKDPGQIIKNVKSLLSL